MMGTDTVLARAQWRVLSSTAMIEFIRQLTISVRPQVAIMLQGDRSELVSIERVKFGTEFTVSESPDGRMYCTADEVTTYGALVEGERFCCDRAAQRWFVRFAGGYALLTGAAPTSPFGQPSDDAQPIILPDAPIRRLVVSEMCFSR